MADVYLFIYTDVYLYFIYLYVSQGIIYLWVKSRYHIYLILWVQTFFTYYYTIFKLILFQYDIDQCG